MAMLEGHTGQEERVESNNTLGVIIKRTWFAFLEQNTRICLANTTASHQVITQCGSKLGALGLVGMSYHTRRATENFNTHYSSVAG